MTFAKALFHNPQLNWGIYNAYSAAIKNVRLIAEPDMT